MANLNLKFLRGLQASLPTTGTDGYFYLTTDTHRLYTSIDGKVVPVNEGVTTVENLDALTSITDAKAGDFFYCTEENILTVFNGQNFVQINPDTGATSVEVVGEGNAVTSASYDAATRKLTLTKGETFATKTELEAIHSHDNKSVLDGITAEKVAAWDASEQNAKDYADDLDDAMDTRVKAVEAAIGENGSVATQIKTAIEALDYTDVAVDGEYVSAVNEVDGKISVTRKALPDYTNTYDAKGAANTAFENAKAYADGLASNYDEKGAAAGVKTELEAEIAKKVDKVEGKSLIADSEIARLATLANYDDTQVKADIAKKADAEAMTTELGKKVDKADGKDLIATSEIERLATLHNYDDTQVKADIAKKADSETMTVELGKKVDKVEGYSLVSDTEIARLAEVDNYDDTELSGRVTTAEGKIADLETESAKHALKTELEAVDKKFEDYTKTADLPTDLGDFTNNVGYAKTADVNAELDKKADKTQVATDIANAIAPLATTEALNGVKEIAEAARTESEVDGQIDAKIAALNLATTYEPIGAETRAKAYADGLISDANLDQYTTEQEVKDIVDTVIAGAVDGDTITGLANLVEYLNTHGAEAKEMGAAIDVLEGKVEAIEGKPAYGITATQISNWDGEVGAKALAETKLDASTFTEYSNAHAGDYTNKQIDDAIDADIATAIEAEVARANAAYDTKGDAAKAQAAAEATAAGALASARTEITTEIGNAISGEVSRADGKYEEKGVAQGIVDALKLSETYEPIGAETRAIAAAKTETEKQVEDLAKTLYTKDEVDALISQAHQWGEF